VQRDAGESERRFVQEKHTGLGRQSLPVYNEPCTVDGMSADSTYAEQYTTWHLANAPILGNRVKLTRCDLVHVED
jgi:hypothetical protein